MATGKIGADGTFTLTTYATGDGAAVGKHTVILHKVGVTNGT